MAPETTNMLQTSDDQSSLVENDNAPWTHYNVSMFQCKIVIYKKYIKATNLDTLEYPYPLFIDVFIDTYRRLKNFSHMMKTNTNRII